MEGKSFSDALSPYPYLFSSLYTNMIHAGETSGTLEIVLDRLADIAEKQIALKNRIRSAMTYPIFMSVLGAIILLVLLTYIVPSITSIFSDMNQVLPAPTRFLIAMSDFLKSYWWLIIIFIALIAVLVKYVKKTDRGSRLLDELKLKTPIFGKINGKIIIARFGRTLGSLTQSGVNLISSLQIVRNVVNNGIIAGVIDNAVEQIQQGKSLAQPLSNCKWIPPVVVQMIAVGEQSGELEKMLNKIADIHEQQVESQISALTSLLEPVMLLVMAAIVGFIAFSVLLPIMEMSQIVH